MRYRFLIPVAAVVTALLFTAVPPVPAAGIPKVTFEGLDYAINGPDTLPAGLMMVEIVNKGKDLHHIQILRLEEGKTLKDFVEAAKANPAVIYGNISWVQFDGGPNGVIPGDSASAVVNLEPGNYVVACIIPDPKGVPHVNLGMVKALTVEGPAAAKVSEPKAALTITAHEFNFSPSKPIMAGKQTIRFNNEGTQPHEILVVQLPPGKTMQDFAAAFAPGATGPPPGKPVGGLSGVYQGGHEYFTADFKPGHYGIICFFEDAAKKAPHFALGMTYEFDVK